MIVQLYGEFAGVMKKMALKDYFSMNNAWDTLRPFPPVQRAQIVRLACLEPIAKGLHITHWTSKDLAREAIRDGIVETISSSMVRRILQQVDFHPHRTRYWKTSRLDDQFKERAEKVLWCYANAERLLELGYWVVCVDEIPNFQILERDPIRRAIPGSIEQREFEYVRHGTINLLMFLVVHSGKMKTVCLDLKSAKNYVRELRRFRNNHRQLKGIYLIHDCDPTHTAAWIQNYLKENKHFWRSRLTPVRASWLDQAEMLNEAFSYRYLARSSWKDREQFVDNMASAQREYNHLYAHPFEWTWTNQQMRRWFEKHRK
jgi:hypothetical protein